MPDKLTDNEIVKALECCANEDNADACDDCPCKDGKCIATTPYALDLINRLQAENKRLSTLAELGNTRANDYRVMRDRALKAEAEVERLKFNLKAVLDERADHTEAYKECIEKVKLKSSSCVATNNGIVVAGSRTYTISETNLANLLKELVGENDAR